MYRPYFGLHSLPFKTSPDLSMFYKHGSRQEILDALVYTIDRGDGIVKVTGEVGSGKTMLLRLLANELSANFEIIYINSPNLSATDMLLYISSELAINFERGVHKFDVTNAIKCKLLELHASNRRVVMLVDEAQSMTFDALEELRLLSNLETESDKLLQMVLFGQPELDIALANERVRPLKSRISYNIFVPPLNADEVMAYLNYRVRKSGYSGLDLFDSKVSKKLCKLSSGLPRTINVIADKALMATFGANDTTVKSKYLTALDDTEFNRVSSKKIVLITFVGLVSFFLVLFVLLKFNEFTLPLIAQKENTIAPVIENSNLESPARPEKVVSSAVSTRKTTTGLSQAEAGNTQMIVPVDVVATKVSKNSRSSFIISDSNAIVGDPFQLSNLVKHHQEAAQWLKDLPEKYVIQLSTRHVKSLDETLVFYKKYFRDLNQVKLLIDYNKSTKNYRLKVFYKSSTSVAALNNEITNLPSKLKRSKPYVTTVEQITNNLRYTDKKLKEVGILYE